MLKDLLINIGLVIDNKYLDKYVELIESARDNGTIKGRTQHHHIVPKAYYKEKKLEIDNSQENLVHLLHYQHILAHWYLFKCAKEDYFIYASSYALLYMLRIHELPEDEDAIVSLAINYGEVYSEFCARQSARYKGKPGATRGRKMSPETCKKLSLAHKGKVQSEETKEKRRQSLLKMYAEGRRKQVISEETKEKLRKSITGRKWINKDGKNKQVRPEELAEYQASGWVLGRYFTEEKHKQLSDSQKGRTFSEETRQKMREAKLHQTYKNFSGQKNTYKCMNNGKIDKRVYTEEDEKQLLAEGFTYGTLKQLQRKQEAVYKDPSKQATLGRKLMHNGKIQKMIPKENIDEYVKKGWKVGSLKNDCKSNA